MPKTVKAAVTLAPGKMEIREFPYPKLEKGGAIVKMAMTGICGLDKHAYKGENILYAGTDREREVNYPVIPGHENVGTIVEISDEGKNSLELYGQPLKEGDRVLVGPNTRCGVCYDCTHNFGVGWCQNFQTYGVTISCNEPPYILGGSSEYLYVKPKTTVVKIPDGISFKKAVIAEPITCVYGIDKAKEMYSMPREGFSWMDPVAVIGVGPIGLLHVMKARLYGAGDVIALDMSDYRLNMARDFGANHTINIEKVDQKERSELINDITKGLGVQVVVDAVGYPEAFLEGLTMVRNGGVFIESGAYVETGTVPISPHRHIMVKNVRLLGVSEIAYVDFDRAFTLLEKYSSQFPFEKVVSHQFSIDEAEEAILKSMDLNSMKVVITQSPE